MKITNKKRIAFILIATVVIFGIIMFMPTKVSAATGEATINVSTLSGTNTSNSSSTAESQWSYTSSDKILHLETGGGNYILTGTNNNIAVRVSASNVKVTFDNLRITSPNATPITAFEIGNTYTNCTINLRGVSTLIASSTTSDECKYGLETSEDQTCTITSSTNGLLFVRTNAFHSHGKSMYLKPDSTLRIIGNARVNTMESNIYTEDGVWLENGSTLYIAPNAAFTIVGGTSLKINGGSTSVIVDGLLEIEGRWWGSAIYSTGLKKITFGGNGTIASKGFYSEAIWSNQNIRMGDGLTFKLTNGPDADNIQTLKFEKIGTANTYRWKLTGALKSTNKMTDSVITVTLPKSSTGTITREIAVPAKTSISAITEGVKQMKVTWKKLPAVQPVTKYEVSYRAKGESKWTTKEYAPTSSSAVIKGLKTNKTYQVKVRSYLTVSKVKYYSPWSAVKTSKQIR